MIDKASESAASIEDIVRQLSQDLVGKPIWICTLPGRTPVFVSTLYRRTWGVDPHEIMRESRTFDSLVHPEDAERVRASWVRQQRGVKTHEVYRIFHPCGEVRWISEKTFPIFDRKGRLAWLMGLATDISEWSTIESEGVFFPTSRVH